MSYLKDMAKNVKNEKLNFGQKIKKFANWSQNDPENFEK
jgi:hypothetical protein